MLFRVGFSNPLGYSSDSAQVMTRFLCRTVRALRPGVWWIKISYLPLGKVLISSSWPWALGWLLCLPRSWRQGLSLCACVLSRLGVSLGPGLTPNLTWCPPTPAPGHTHAHTLTHLLAAMAESLEPAAGPTSVCALVVVPATLGL